jgi:CubicO group peptidase (beta-lactamase class C family)
MPSPLAPKPFQSFLDSLIQDGTETGLQLTAYINGKLALDTWAGTLSPGGPPVTADTLFPIYSTGKGVTATVIHLLAERRKLDYDTPIAKYWPAFAANGKEKITVRHALNHTAGLAYIPREITWDQFHNYNAMIRWLEQTAPSSPPGQEQLYHAVTYGWILAELAHKADGRPFTQIVNEDICRPLAITDMYFGIPDEILPRVAICEGKPPETPPTSKPDRATIPDGIVPLANWMNHPDARRAMIPGSTAIMNTRSLAKHYAALLPGGIDGIELLPPARIKLALEMQRPLSDPVTPTRRGLGYVTGKGDPVFGDRETAFGHNGYGGSTAFAEPTTNLALAFARNRLIDNDSPGRIVKEAIRALGIAKQNP